MLKRMIWCALLIGAGSMAMSCASLSVASKNGEVLSRAFELRYVSDDPAADGETDFKGETAVFDTAQRIEYLGHWAAYGQRFFDDPRLDTPAYMQQEVTDALDQLKPPPQPEVRREIAIDQWKFLGHREGQRAQERAQLEAWSSQEGTTITNGRLHVRDATVRREFEPQAWRAHFQWQAMMPRRGEATFRLGDAATLGFDTHGDLYYITAGRKQRIGTYEPDRMYHFRVELDLAAGHMPEVGSFSPQHPAYLALDGNLASAWYAADGAFPQTITFDLGRNRDIERVRLAFGQAERTYDYDLLISADGKTWSPIVTSQSSDASQTWTDDRFAPTSARFLRVRVTGASQGWASLAMIEVEEPDGRIDLAAHNLNVGRYNLYIDDQKVADFVPFTAPGSPLPDAAHHLAVDVAGELVLDDLWFVSFGKPLPHGWDNVRVYPFTINTLVDDRFQVRPDPDGFEQIDYDDSDWSIIPYRRYAHGGERRAGETLYLRRKIDVGHFERAILKVETVRHAGVLYINGREVARLGRHPKRLDVTEFLTPNEENLFAVKIDPYEVQTSHDAAVEHGGVVEGLLDDAVRPEEPKHMSVDRWSSWFAGFMDLELTRPVFVDDVFAYTAELGAPVTLRVQIALGSQQQVPFAGRLLVSATPWYPQESAEPVATSSSLLRIEAGDQVFTVVDLAVPDPKLWTVRTPHLYKVSVRIEDAEGRPIDDKVITTGIRTVSQEGGTFRLNGEPFMLNGPLIFAHHYPLERIAQWMFSPPEHKWVEQILATRNMNGNVLRMTVHDRWISGPNDPRLAQIADQLGMMIMWQTPAWIREGSTEDFDFDGLVKYAREVRNHPSIVMWQPGNHPYGVEWSSLRRFGDPDDPDFRLRGITNANRRRYLDSDTHAWFDFESEETIAQPNWALQRAQPYHHMYSYEKGYDRGSIGRVLGFDQWRESQAWQALSAYEAYRKKRWLGYDGTNWCPLRGGGNTATYMKPVLDYEDRAKLAYHALRMVYQPVLAGSRNVDIVYGPNDMIPIMVLNLGEARMVDVTVQAKTMDGQTVAERRYEGVALPAGRSVTDLPAWRPEFEAEQHYGIEYIVRESAR